MKDQVELERVRNALRWSMRRQAAAKNKEVFDTLYETAAVIEWVLEVNSEGARDIGRVINTALRMDQWRKPS
jgi:hypothetical protein